MTVEVEKDMGYSEEENIEGTENNDANNADNNTQLNFKMTNFPAFTNFPCPHILPPTCPHSPTPVQNIQWQRTTRRRMHVMVWRTIGMTSQACHKFG